MDAPSPYSRSIREKNLTGRPVCTLVGRESALLRNTTELIQQNVAERMTFLIADLW